MAQDAAHSYDDALRVRKQIGGTWEQVHAKLAAQVQARGKKPLAESLVRNLKIASDQLRLDYRLDAEKPEPAAEAAPGTVSANPLADLRIVG